MKNGVLPIPRPLGPTRSSPKLTIGRANVPVAFPSLPLAVAALVVVVAVDQIIVGGGRCTRRSGCWSRWA